MVALRTPRLTPNAVGALWMVGNTLCFSVMSTLVKYLGDDYSPAVQAFYRQLATFILVLPIIVRHGRAAFHTTRPGVMLFRAATMTGGMILSFYGFQMMPLVTANAISFTRALWLVPLAILILHEKVGPVRIGAAVVGFLGILIMLRPGPDSVALGLPALAMVISSLMFAFAVVGMKQVTHDHPPMVILVWSATLGVLLAVPMAALEWKWPTAPDAALLFATGAFGLVGQHCYIKSMQSGDAMAMASIDYLRLVFTAIAGFVVFGEVPTVWVVIGGAVVVAATLVVTLREMQVARRKKGPDVVPQEAES